MKTTSTQHSYQQYRKEHPDKQTSEGWRIRQAEEFQTKVDRTQFHKKTDAERSELKTRMYAFPNKNHSPVGFNISI